MLTVPHVRAVAESYRDTNGEALKSRELILMLLACATDPFARSHYHPGHITATGLVLAPDGESLLLVHHRRLDRWLLPGGHVESEDEWVWDSARREVIEETGATLAAEPVPLLANMDVHGIPSNGREPYHLHHDMIFAFRATQTEIVCSPESREVVWCGPADFDGFALPAPIREAYRRARLASR